MNVLKRLLLAALLLVSGFAGYAQNRISGVVTGSDGAPLSGVTVTVRGTTRSAQTNSQGTYTITAQAGETLRFTYVGYEAADVRVGENTSYNVQLKPGDNTLETVTVAMDMKRNPKELPFSVQKLNGNEIAETQRENFLTSLQGRVAGLTLNSTSGMAGASQQIVLRGFNSVSLENSPLFIIDGVIMDNQTMAENHGGAGGTSGLGLASARENRNNDYSNRMSDLNPNDIESITILKGPEATALYGSQAGSGAIVITTKKGNNTGRVSITYDNNLRFSKQTRYPKIFTGFDAGTNGIAENTFVYFGPEFDGSTQLYNNDPAKVFFRTGFTQSHNLSAEYGKNNYTFRFSGSALHQEATVPTNTYDRYSARITNTTKFGKYVDISPSLTFTRTTNDKPLRGASGYMLNMLIWPADFDITDWETEDGRKKAVYASNANAELDNPFFNVHRNRSADHTNRFQGTMGINVNPVKWLSMNGRFGYDRYKTEGYIVYHPQSFYVTRGSGGQLDNYFRNFIGYNHTVTATARHKIGDFSGRVMVGQMWQDNETNMFSIVGTRLVDSVNTAGQMMKNGVVLTQADYDRLLGSFPDSNLTNSVRTKLSNATRFGDNTPNQSIYRQAAYFGEFAINWRSAIFLTYSHRFEETSVLKKENRKFNYPAGGLSIMLTDLIPGMKGKVLDYAKLRASRANTARAGAPYANQKTFNINTGSGGGYYYGFNNANPDLVPEKQITYEVGTELRFMNSRVNLDVTYYNTLNKDVIFELARASYGTGSVLNTLNIGSIRNTGIEVAFDAVPVQTKNLKWTTRLNFNRMRNKVEDFPLPEFYISDTWLFGNARAGLKPGEPTTTITGLGYQRNNAGQILISPTTGLPLTQPTNTPTWDKIGDRAVDFTLGIQNILTYKNFRVSMLWDLRVGGDIFNATDMYLTGRGRSLRTADRLTPRVIEGVLADGLENTPNPTPNTISVIPYYNQTYYGASAMPEEQFVEHDINALRLRDLSFNYNFPQSRLKGLRYFKSLSVFLTGNELVLITNYTGADPNVNGNTPGTRGVGSFGFDYGNIGTPISLSLGLRAGF